MPRGDVRPRARIRRARNQGVREARFVRVAVEAPTTAAKGSLLNRRKVIIRDREAPLLEPLRMTVVSVTFFLYPWDIALSMCVMSEVSSILSGWRTVLLP